MLSGQIRGYGQIKNELQNPLFVRNVPGRQRRHAVVQNQSTPLLLWQRDAVRSCQISNLEILSIWLQGTNMKDLV
jgi:hypothetical protein